MAAFLSGANLRLFDSLLPSVAADFAVDPTSVGIVVTAFTLAYGLFQIVYGPLGDRLGKMRVSALATIFAALACLGAGFATGIGALAVLRFLTGMGIAAVIPMALAWIGDKSAYEQRQATLGRFVGFLLLGQVMGPALGGVLSQILSWRGVLHGLAVAFLLVGVVLLLEDRKQRLLAPEPAGGGNVLHGYVDLVAQGWVRIVLITIFIEGALFFGTFAYIGAFLKQRFGISFALIGIILACYGLGGFVYSLLVKRLLARLGEAGFVRLAGFILLLCFSALPWLPVWALAFPLILVTGFGLYMLHNTLQTKATEMAPGARGTAIALFAFSLFLGQAFGTSLAGLAIRTAGYPAVFTAVGVLLLVLARWFGTRLSRQSRA
jgi:predicted MFS family arabinose efflux permease